MATFCFCPPESVAISRSRRSLMPTVSSVSRTRRSIWSWGTPKFSRPKSISSSTTEGDHLRVDILQYTADDLRHVGQRDLAGVVAVNHDGSKERAGVVVGLAPDRQAASVDLPAPEPDDADEISLVHAERDVAKRLLDLRAIGERDIVDVDDRFHGYLS